MRRMDTGSWLNDMVLNPGLGPGSSEVCQDRVPCLKGIMWVRT